MDNLTNEHLQRIAGGVLEESAFLLLDAVDAPRWQGDVLMAEVEYSGPGTGCVRLTASPALDHEAAANMLGTDEGDPAGQPPPGTALGELANIVAGVLVAEMFGTTAVCHLGIPTVREGQALPFPGNSERFVAFSDDGGRFITIEVGRNRSGEAAGVTP